MRRLTVPLLGLLVLLVALAFSRPGRGRGRPEDDADHHGAGRERVPGPDAASPDADHALPAIEAEDEQTRRPVGAAAASTYGAHLIVASISFLTVLLVSRSLGAEGRGDFVLVTTIVIFAAILASFSIQSGIANIGALGSVAPRTLVSTTLLGVAGLGAIGMASVVALALFVPGVTGGVAPLLVASTSRRWRQPPRAPRESGDAPRAGCTAAGPRPSSFGADVRRPGLEGQ